MKVLDLFCGGGGAATGIKQACPDVYILGIDINPQPEYPFDFAQTDFRELKPWQLRQYDFIWASPPCQAFSVATPNKAKHPNYINTVRALLLKAKRPYVIENVPAAPIRHDLLLCGEMFKLKIIRHRYFEIYNFIVKQPKHVNHKGLTLREAIKRKKEESWYYHGVYGNGNYNQDFKEWQKAMGITHIKKRKTLVEAVPPAYSKYIFTEFLKGKKQLTFDW